MCVGPSAGRVLALCFKGYYFFSFWTCAALTGGSRVLKCLGDCREHTHRDCSDYFSSANRYSNDIRLM